MENGLVARCARCLKRHTGRCTAAAVIGSIAFMPAYLGAKDGQAHEFALPIATAGTSTATTASWTTQTYVADPTLDREIAAPTPALWSAAKSRPAEIRPKANASTLAENDYKGVKRYLRLPDDEKV